MILQNIKIKNFRCFYGDNATDFASHKNKKITVIHAENHSGKTNFIDAFRWCFYEKMQGEHPEQIVNHLALAEAKTGAEILTSVTVKFSYENCIYEFSRGVTEVKINKDNTERKDGFFRANVTGVDGRNREISNAARKINSILPEGMDQYFFLAGENIQELGGEESTEKIKNAIKILMGLEIFERAINDLGGKTKKILRDELDEVAAGDAKILLKEIRELEKKQEDAKKDIKNHEDNNIALGKERDSVVKQLIRTKLTEEIEKKRKALEKLQVDTKGKYDANNDSIIRKISKEGYLAFVKDLVQETQKMLEDKRKKGIIPSHTKYGLLKDLLDLGKCICGRTLIKGEKAHTIIKEKMENPKNAPEYEEAFSHIGQAASSLAEASKRFPSELGQLVKLRNQYQLDLLKIKEDLEDVDKDYDSKEYEDERDLIDKRKRIERKISDNDSKIGGLQRDFDNYEKKVKELERKRQKTETENKVYKVRNKRLDLCIKTHDFLEELYDSLVNRDRIILRKQINNIFQDIIQGREDANIELEDDFRLRVNKRLHDGAIRPLARSGAESQITCISFILSVITIAKKNLQEPTNIFSRGGEYPLILDSPFGVLAEYRKKVASTLAKFSNQLTILVAPQQWDQNIENELESFIGKRYVFHRSAPKKEAKTIRQKIKGKEYTLVEYIDGKVKTDIEEVK